MASNEKVAFIMNWHPIALVQVRDSISEVSCWTQDQTRAGWHGFQSHLGQLIFIKTLSLIFSVKTRCCYLLESVAFIPLYRNEHIKSVLMNAILNFKIFIHIRDFALLNIRLIRLIRLTFTLLNKSIFLVFQTPTLLNIKLA